MSRRALVLVALLSAACGDPAAAPPRLPVDVEVRPPALRPAPVEPVDPAVVRPRVLSPRVAPPLVLGGSQVDTFRQSEAIVDILWVIDTSGSMADERERLADAFATFLDEVVASRADFRVGVVTTEVDGDAEDGRLVGPFIDLATPGPVEAFRALLDQPESPLRREQGLEAARLALEPARNPGFLRPSAALAVIVLSDEDDDSFGGPAHFARVLDGAKGRGMEGRVTVSAIAGPLPDGCRRPGDETVFRGGAKPAERYDAVVDATGGAFGSICADDFTGTLRRVATALDMLRDTFPLTLQPVPERIVVTIDLDPDDAAPPIPPPAGSVRYDAEENAVVFAGWIPPPGARIEVAYPLAESAP